MPSVITVTDTSNNPIKQFDFGDLASAQTYSFRVWNNLAGIVGISNAEQVTLNLIFSPFQKFLISNLLVFI